MPTQQTVTLTIEQAIQQAIANHQAGKLQDAERLYRAILQAQPTHPDANHNLGVLAVQARQPAASLPHFKTALEANPNQSQYWLSYIDALIQSGQTEIARKVLEQGRQQGLSGEAAESLTLRLGAEPVQQEKENLVALFAGGKYAEAETLARTITDRFPLHSFGWKLLGASLQMQGKDALFAMKRSTELLPADAQAHSNLGNALRELGQLGAAAASCCRAIEINPNYAELYNNMGNVFQALGRLNDAVTSYRRALEIKPDLADVYNNLGGTQQELGLFEDAVASCRRAIEIRPDYAEAHNNLGNALRDLGQFENSAVICRRAIEIKPGYAEAHSNLGNALGELGLLVEEAASCRLALEFKPDFAEAHNNLGGVLQEIGQLDAAVISYRRALEIKPLFAGAHNNLGGVEQELGQFEDSLAYCRRAIEIRPDYTDAYKNLGLTLQYLGRPNEAETNYQRMLEIKSDHISGEPTARITALLPFGRSGSLFFHSLFDGHPGLATLPGVYFKGWFGMDQWRRFSPNAADSRWRERLVEAILQEYQPLFDARCKKNVAGEPMGDAPWLAASTGFMNMGDDRSQHFEVDQETFAAVFLSLLAPLSSIGQRDCFERIHRAFEIAIRGNKEAGSQGNGHIFYHIHNPNPYELAHFLQHYPQAGLLHIIRNPVQGMESWMMLDAVRKKDNSKLVNNNHVSNKIEFDHKINCWYKMVTKVATMFVQMQSPFNRSPHNRGVRLEDVKRNAHKVMPQIAAWMGIPDHPALYEASFCGLQYWGPTSQETGNITGFDTKAIDQPLGRLLGSRDILIFETLFWPLSDQYGYTELDAAGFRRQLSEIRPWLDEPLEFELRLYDALPDRTLVLEELFPYKRLHRLLQQNWTMLERDGAYHGMVQPLKLD